MMTGEISSLGGSYVVNLNATDCQTGDVLAREQAEAASKEEVLGALGKTITGMRRELGESLATIESYDAPVQEATTHSLEALKAFSIGEETRASEGDPQAVPFYRRAVELDPGFALAHARLGAIYSNTGQTALEREHKTRAYELRDRVSERERVYITAHYWALLGNSRKEMEVYELWKRAYSRDWTPYNNQAILYTEKGDFERALELALEARERSPDDVLPNGNVARFYQRLGRLDEAVAAAEQAKQRGVEIWQQVLFDVGYERGDQELMDRQVAALEGTPAERWTYSWKGAIAASAGRMEDSRALMRRSVDASRSLGDDENAAWTLGWAANHAAMVGDAAQAKALAEEAMSLSQGHWVRDRCALALALIGEVDEAQRLIDELAVDLPEHFVIGEISLPVRRAVIAVERGRAADALEILRPVAQYELGYVDAMYVRGQASLVGEQPAEAREAFQKIVDNPGVSPLHPIHSLARLGLARAYSAAGDRAAATSSYQDFLELWRDADSDVPLYRQAQAEYEALRELPRG